MKNIIIFLLCFTPYIALSENSESLQKTLSIEEFEVKGFEALDSESEALLRETFYSDPDFFNRFIEYRSEAALGEVDYSVLVEAAVAKKDLEEEFSANQLEEFQQFINKSIAAEANFPIANSSGQADTNIFAVQYIAYREVPKNSGKYIGYGLYMTINTSSLEGSIGSNLPYLVASATVNSKQFTYNARLIGFNGVEAHKLLREAMPGSSFGIDTYVGYEKFKDALIDGLESREIKLSPVPIDPMFRIGNLEADALALARIHALIQIAKRSTLTDALESHSGQTESFYSTIKKTYDEHAEINGFSKKPNRESSEKARNMLATIGVDV